MEKIYVFGDSIAFGELVSSNKNWPSLIGKYFDDNGKSILVQNFSKNGDTTRLALDRIGFEYQCRKLTKICQGKGTSYL